MEYLLKEAVRVAIVTEKNSYDFYRSAAAKAHNGSVRRLCARLADKGVRHLEQLLRRHPGSEFGHLERLRTTPPQLTSPRHRVLLASMVGSPGEKAAWHVALQEQEIGLEAYSVLVAALREPTVHALFQEVLDESLRHCEVIREELHRFAVRADQQVPRREVTGRWGYQRTQTPAGHNLDSSCWLLPA